MRRILLGLLSICSLAATPATQPVRFRPVAFVAISQVPLQNPRGKTETVSQYVARLKPLYMATASTVVKIGKDMNAKAEITWDASTDDLQPFKYIGDPALVHYTFDPINEQWFAVIHDAGIETGVCIRPGWIVRDVTGRLVYTYADNYVWCMLTKMQWAVDHYKCTWVYCDSTVGPEGFPLDPRPMILLSIQMPNVHWFIENVGVPQDGVWHGYAYVDYGVVGHFIDARQYTKLPQDGLKHLIGNVGPEWAPQKNPDNSTDNSRFNDMVDAIRRGDEVMYEGWWSNPMNPVIKSMFDAANRN